MINETITAIGLASRRAAMNLTSQRDWTTQIAHVREWSFAMPYLTRVTVANSPVHQFYLGPSRQFLHSLGPSEAARHQAMEAFLETLKVNLLASLPAKRPIVQWERLEPSADPRVLRGVRSFILRHQGPSGNLYLMADLASRQEYESMRDPEWGDQVASQLLPADLGRIDCIENQAMLDRVSSYLTRCEHDVELLVPGPDGDVHSVNGVILHRHKRDDHHVLQLSLDLDRRAGVEIQPGTELEGAFGAAGRVFRFRTACLGESQLSLDGLGHLECVDLEFPRRFHLDQRRRYYRVMPSDGLAAQVTVLTPSPVGEEEVAAGGVCHAQVVDLSFSGAGLSCSGPIPEGLGTDARVRVDLTGEELSRPLSITGLVRRVLTRPCGRGREETLFGLEFVVAESGDRQATQQIRQYVMVQQRSLLTLRSRDLVSNTS